MKIFRNFLGILLVCGFAGCTVNTPISQSISTQQAEGQPQHLPQKNVDVSTAKGQIHFKAQVADSAEERRIGLMNRSQMPADEAMIFLFDNQMKRSFWMKNTLIPLDIIYLDKDLKVASIQKSVKPCPGDPCPSYPSTGPAKYVLEINGGLSDKLGIVTGAQLEMIN